MAKSKKGYVVFRGKVPGIYSTWLETEQQVKKVANNRHKSYCTLEAAHFAWVTYNNTGLII
jgi:viroplasmin and RNaseH domain-containing protein